MENKNKDKREQVKGATLKVVNVEAELGSFGEEKDKIKRIALTCITKDEQEIRITHKPKEEETENRNGVICKRDVMASNPPEIISKISQEINKFGLCMVIADYTAWQQWSDELKDYKAPVRYIQWQSTLDKWEIVQPKGDKSSDLNGELYS